MKPFKIPEFNDFEKEAIERVREQLSISSALFVRTVIMMAVDELAVKTAKDYANAIFTEKIDELRPDNYG
jgi:hypothetical protein